MQKLPAPPPQRPQWLLMMCRSCRHCHLWTPLDLQQLRHQAGLLVPQLGPAAAAVAVEAGVEAMLEVQMTSEVEVGGPGMDWQSLGTVSAAGAEGGPLGRPGAQLSPQPCLPYCWALACLSLGQESLAGLLNHRWDQEPRAGVLPLNAGVKASMTAPDDVAGRWTSSVGAGPGIVVGTAAVANERGLVSTGSGCCCPPSVAAAPRGPGARAGGPDCIWAGEGALIGPMTAGCVVRSGMVLAGPAVAGGKAEAGLEYCCAAETWGGSGLGAEAMPGVCSTISSGQPGTWRACCAQN